MGLFDAILGRTKPVKPNLDVLFAVPAAALSVQAVLDFAPTNTGSVCFRHPEGVAAEQTQREIGALLALDPASTAQVSVDEFNFSWVTCRRPDGDLAALVTDLHAVNRTLDDAGFGPALLCTVIGFAQVGAGERRLALVYLYKRGTFYPFAPSGHRAHDVDLELRVRAAVGDELPIEKDLTRWFPIWDAPGL